MHLKNLYSLSWVENLGSCDELLPFSEMSFDDTDCIREILFNGLTLSHSFQSAQQVPSFEKKHDLWPCMVAPTKIIAGLGLSLGIDILDAPGATGDYRTLLTSKATAIAKGLSAPLQACPNVFVPGEDEFKPGRADGYDFGFLHVKVSPFSPQLPRMHRLVNNLWETFL